MTGTPARKPDVKGWYNHPVDVAFTGTDAGSGISECSPTVSYKGPDADPAKLVGQCRDAAGHLSAPTTVELRYDGTPPARPNLRWVRRGTSMSLAWTAGKDVVVAKVMRSPGLKGKKAGVVYQGKARKFVDRKLRAGGRYWYEVTLVDQAGNESSKTVGLQPTEGIFSPADGAVVAELPARRSGPREQGPVLQPPALAREPQAPDHLGQAPEAGVAAALEVQGSRGARSSTAATGSSSGPRSGRRRTPATASSSARSGSSSSVVECPSTRSRVRPWPKRTHVRESAQRRRKRHLAGGVASL